MYPRFSVNENRCSVQFSQDSMLSRGLIFPGFDVLEVRSCRSFPDVYWTAGNDWDPGTSNTENSELWENRISGTVTFLGTSNTGNIEPCNWTESSATIEMIQTRGRIEPRDHRVDSTDLTALFTLKYRVICFFSAVLISSTEMANDGDNDTDTRL